MKAISGKHLIICVVLFLFLCPFSARGASLLSDIEIANINAGVIHPFSEEPIVVYVENYSSATVPADDFYWGDLNGFRRARNAGFVVGSMPDTRYTLVFPNIYATTTAYEDVPSQMRIPGKFDSGEATSYGYSPRRVAFANQPMFPWWYDPTEVKDVTLPHVPGKKDFIDHDWGAVLSWIDRTGADALFWEGNLLVPADTVFMAAAHSTLEITTPRICLTVALAHGLPDDDTRPDLAMVHETENQLGTLCVENVMVRVQGGITDKDSTVENVVVVYPNF